MRGWALGWLAPSWLLGHTPQQVGGLCQTKGPGADPLTPYALPSPPLPSTHTVPGHHRPGSWRLVTTEKRRHGAQA